jgi:hypothetical protein
VPERILPLVGQLRTRSRAAACWIVYLLRGFFEGLTASGYRRLNSKVWGGFLTFEYTLRARAKTSGKHLIVLGLKWLKSRVDANTMAILKRIVSGATLQFTTLDNFLPALDTA